jgi:hypothetical protein
LWQSKACVLQLCQPAICVRAARAAASTKRVAAARRLVARGVTLPGGEGGVKAAQSEKLRPFTKINHSRTKKQIPQTALEEEKEEFSA